MSKVERWKGIFSKSKPSKKTVRVGDSFEEFTHTQAYRFEQLAQANGKQRQETARNPFDRAHYSLGDAAFRLMTSEADVLGMAGAGDIYLFIPTSGISGRWRHLASTGGATESPEMTLNAGHLALTVASCQELATSPSVEVSLLHFPRIAGVSTLEFDAGTEAALSTSADTSVAFLMTTPRRVGRDEIMLLASLPPLARE